MNKRLFVLYVFLVLMFSSITCYAGEGLKHSFNIYPINHVMSQGFIRDGDYYTPRGRILWKINKSEFPVFATLDEYIVIQPVSGTLTTVLLNGKQEYKASIHKFSMNKLDSYVHLATRWDITKIPRGHYALVTTSNVNGTTELINANALVIE